MANDNPDLLTLQAPSSAPYSEGLATGTDLILPPRPVRDRLAHLPEEVYDLSPDSHLVRLISAIIGDSGLGQLRKRLMMARLQRTLNGSHFYDLDRFWGALFGVRRTPAEILDFDPTGSVASPDEWDDAHGRDASYRSRIEQFSRALSFGATPTGIELMAEAILSVDCDVYESFSYVQRQSVTYDALEAYTYAELEEYTYDELEGRAEGGGALNRWTFTVYPRRPITPGERYDLLRVLSRMKPANTLVDVQPGVQAHVEAPIASLAADSEHWEIHEKRSGSPTPRPPFSGYQGALWSYNSEVAGVAATALGWAPGVTPERVKETRYQLPNGTWLTYRPDMSLAEIQRVAATSMSSDAQIVAHPYSAGRVSLDGLVSANDEMAPVYVNGEPISAIPPQNVLSRSNKLGMWVTPERASTDRTTEVIEYLFSSPRLINAIDFEVSHYPHNVGVERFDQTTGRWVSIFREEINRSVPQYLPMTRPGSRHHLHSASNHWVKRSIRPPAGFRSDRLRITLQRHQFESGPVLGNRRIPYSLAVRNVNIGYRITGREHIPTTTRPGGSISSTTGPTGEQVEFILSSRRAQDILREGSPKPYWKSEPQPIPGAVVNLYVDMRGADGTPPRIDRFFIDPTHVGAHLSLYHSMDEPTGSFQASDEPIPYGALVAEGAIDAGGDCLSIDDGSSITIAPEVARLDLGRPWLMAAQLRSVVDSSSAGSIDAPLLGVGPSMGVFFDGDLLVADFGDSTSVAAVFSSGQRVRVLAQYEPSTSTLDLLFSSNDSTVSSSIVVDPPLEGQASHFKIGAGCFESIVLKQDTHPDPEALLANLVDYPIRSEFLSEDDGGTDNAIVRMHPSFSAEDNPLGFVGGPPDYWAEMRWTPIARDFSAQVGYLDVPPTTARFWKFEFTNLVAEAYESIVPIRRRVKVFPIGELLKAKLATGTGSTTTLPPDGGMFLDSIGIVQTDDVSRFDERSHRPTSALYATDLSGQLAVGDLSWVFNFSPWHQGTAAPQFVDIQPHSYEIHTIEHSNKMAFFAGLRSLRAFSVDYQTDDDTVVYRERFDDETGIEDSTWDLAEGALWSPDESSVATSIERRSVHDITALQFASQQTPAVQLLPDDGFEDPALNSYSFDDDALWHAYGDAAISYRSSDRTILVRRDTAAPEIEVEELTGVVDDPVSVLGLPLASLSGSDACGGIESPQVALSPAGYVHAAVRVHLEDRLSHPLRLELVGEDGQVLASTEVDGDPGETVERTVSYRIGSLPVLPSPSGEWEYKSIVSTPVHEVSGGDDTDLYSGPISYTTVISDSFDRSDAGSLGVTDGSGEEDPSAWTYPSSGHELQVVDGHAVSVDGDPGFAVVSLPSGNGRVSMVATGGVGSLLFRFQDIDNHWVALVQSDGTVELVKVQAGVPTSIDTEAGSSVEGELAVEMNGNTIRVLLGGTLKITYTDGFLAGTPSAGLYAEDDTAGASSWSFGRPQGVPTPDSSDSFVRVRLVQEGLASNQWRVDALSLFDESILWEFSNDSGATWMPAHQIRNNPNGVLSFPSPGKQLRWRVSGFREGLSVSSLQVRPWYADRMHLRTAGVTRGPNISSWDQEPPIDEDPEFKVWSAGVPRSWFLAGRRYPLVSATGEPLDSPFAQFFSRSVGDSISISDGGGWS